MYVWYNMCTFLKLTGNCCLGHVLQFCLHSCSCNQCMCFMCSPTIPTSNATSSYPFPKGWARSIVVWLKPKFKEPMVKGTVSSPQKPGHCAHFRWHMRKSIPEFLSESLIYTSSCLFHRSLSTPNYWNQSTNTALTLDVENTLGSRLKLIETICNAQFDYTVRTQLSNFCKYLRDPDLSLPWLPSHKSFPLTSQPGSQVPMNI